MAAVADNNPNPKNVVVASPKFFWIHVPYSELNMEFLKSIEPEFKGNVKFHKVDDEINIEGQNENYVKFAKHLFDKFYMDRLKLNKTLKEIE